MAQTCPGLRLELLVVLEELGCGRKVLELV